MSRRRGGVAAGPADGLDDPAVRALFDAPYYASVADVDPDDALAHYLTTGWRLGLDPHPLFSTRHYLEHSRDVAGVGMCPFVHFVRHGAFELRSPHPLFDPEHYIDHGERPWAPTVNPLVHYLSGNGREGRRPNVWFDGDFYRQHSPDVTAAGVDPLVHYAVFGWREGRQPHPDFDVGHYLRTNPDVAAAGIEPLAHFLRCGARQGRAPSPRIDVTALVARGADIAAHAWPAGDDVSAVGPSARRLVVLTGSPDAFAAHVARCPFVVVAHPHQYVPRDDELVYAPDTPNALSPGELANIAVCVARRGYDFVVVSHGFLSGSVARAASAANALVLSANAHRRRRAGDPGRVGSRGRFVRLPRRDAGALSDLVLDDLGLGPIVRDGAELTIAGRRAISWRPVPSLVPAGAVVAPRHPQRPRLLVLAGVVDGRWTDRVGDQSDHDVTVVVTETIPPTAVATSKPILDAADLVIDVAEVGPPEDLLRTIELLRDDLRPDAVRIDAASPWLRRHAAAVRALFPTIRVDELPGAGRQGSIGDARDDDPSSTRPGGDRDARCTTPALSVVIGTTGVAATLPAALAALEAQTAAREDYEVIVVAETADDELTGWADGSSRRLLVHPGAGVAGRHNLGLFVASAPLVLLLADDECADPELVVEHRRAHARFPAWEIAVVGHTTWAAETARSPLAVWTVAADDVPLGYPGNPRSSAPDVVHLRARQLSVKRAFLARRGVFDPSFVRFADVEMGLRLHLAGIDVRYWSHARSSRLGACDLDALCAELAADGPEIVRLARRDPSGLVGALCAVDGARGVWQRAAPTFDADLAAARDAAAEPHRSLARLTVPHRSLARGLARLTPAGDDVDLFRRFHELLWASRARGVAAALAAPETPPTLRRPVIAGPAPRGVDRPPARPRVLVAGVVLADRANSAPATAAELAAARHVDVDQRWAVVGRPPRRLRRVPELPDRFVAERRTTLAPKYEILGALLAGTTPASYDHVLLVDDDVDLPVGFLDRFLDIQRALGFVLAQPARSAGSPADHPIVLQQPGSLARRTLFVELGPVLSVERSALDAVLPFDLRSPMGWGYECVWSHRLGECAAIGIIDATPVDHQLRPTAAHYAKADSEAGSAALLAAVPHRPLDDCMRVLEVHPLEAERATDRAAKFTGPTGRRGRSWRSMGDRHDETTDGR